MICNFEALMRGLLSFQWWGSAGSLQSTHWSPVGMNHERQIDSSREPSPPGPNMTEFEKTKMNSERNRNVDFHSKQANIDDQIRAIQVKHRRHSILYFLVFSFFFGWLYD